MIQSVRWLGLALTGLQLTACSSLNYYTQALQGQWDIWQRSRPFAEVINAADTEPALKQKLLLIKKIRDFASQKLHLPDNDSYRWYADLQRPFVVWNVFAAPPFSMELKQWCFSFIGCFQYRGYFSQQAAETFADSLRQQGYDVYVAGVAAYSTLGWFTDPLLNTMLTWPKLQLAGLIFHELAHQQVYIPNDTAFNEAFAMVVEYEGIRRWLTQFATLESRQHYQRQRQQQQAVVDLILATRQRLEHLYQQALPKENKQQQKNLIFKQLHEHYQQFKQDDDFADWFQTLGTNNAQLLSIVTYQAYVPALQALLAQYQPNLKEFYAAVRQLADLPEQQRHTRLQQLEAQALEP